jgi:hypothetical protein
VSDSDFELVLFLHELGYNFFSIPGLTYIEMDALIIASNKRRDRTRSRGPKKVTPLG